MANRNTKYSNRKTKNTKKQHTIKDPCQMSNFKFDAPIKVSVLFEEMRPDELNASSDKKTNHSIFINKTIKLNTIERFIPNEKNILNTNHYDKHYRTILQAPDVINDENKTDSNHSLKFPEDIEARNIIKKIDSVSYKIIDIWKYYHNIKLYIKTHNCSQEVAKRNYTDYKYNCYNCLHSNINLIISPLAHNSIFIKSFVKRTALIASCMAIIIPQEFLFMIIDDMINWFKQNKINLERNVQNKKTKKSAINEVEKIYIFNLGPEERKITISVAPEVLTKHLARSKTVEDNKQKEQANRGHINILADNSSYNSNDGYYNFYVNRRGTNATLLANVSTLSVPQANVLNPVLLGKDSEINNLLINDSYNQNTYTMSRSSISRDSGCVSLMDRPPSKDPDEADIQNGVNDNVITQPIHRGDTNSLDNEYMLSSACSVCFLKTSSVCLGCSRKFYCSVECQRKDWPRHSQECRLY